MKRKSQVQFSNTEIVQLFRFNEFDLNYEQNEDSCWSKESKSFKIVVRKSLKDQYRVLDTQNENPFNESESNYFEHNLENLVISPIDIHKCKSLWNSSWTEKKWGDLSKRFYTHLTSLKFW